MKIETPKPTPTQALQLAILFAMVVCWGDTTTADDYGIASLYIVAVIIARWWGNSWTATVAIIFVTTAEVYTNVYTGAYNTAARRGHFTQVVFWGIAHHVVAYTAVSLTIRWILQLVERERTVSQKLFKIMQEVRELESLLPICSYCKKIRDDAGQWEKLETYIADHTGTNFTHGVCPDCKAEQMAEFKATKKS